MILSYVVCYLFQFKDRRCIKREECYEMPRPKEDVMGLQMRPKPYKPHLGKCIIECPPGYGEMAVNLTDQGSKKEQYTCEKCSGKEIHCESTQSTKSNQG